MNCELKYIYPVSRVGSIERLLKVTAHNAFLVVTPLATSEDTSNEEYDAVNKYAPQLYERKSIHPIHTKLAEQRRLKQAKRREQERAIINANRSRGSTVISHSSIVQESPLMFRGIILRSQLVELLRNRIFFDEDDGVSPQ